MNRDDALKKIKKCLALSRSAETHEAGAAMRQAQKLMAEFQVTERELSLVDVREARAKAVTMSHALWETRLVHMTAEAFGCETFTQTSAGYNDAGNWQRQRNHVFVGTEAAPDVAAYAFEVLARQCAKARLAHIQKQPKRIKAVTKSARGDLFAGGWVTAVSDLVERFAQPARDQALLIEYMEAKHPDLRDISPRDRSKSARSTAGHAQAGFAAGLSAQLDRGIGAAAPKGLLS